MTHADFAQRVINEWGVDPRQIHQSCFEAWYHYTIEVEGKEKIIGEYSLRKGKVVFVLHRKDGTEVVYDKFREEL